MTSFPHSQRIVKDLWFAYFCLLAGWPIYAYSELLAYLKAGDMFALSIDGQSKINDFVLTYSGALIASQSAHHHLNIYDVDAQTNAVKALVGPIVPQMPFLLQYPPYFYALIKPLSYFDLPLAWCIWSCCSATLLILSLHWLTAKRFESRTSRLFVLLATVASYPCWLSFRLGQTSTLLLFGTLIFFSFLRTRRFLLCGCTTLFSLVKLQYAPILVLVGIAHGRRKYLKGFLLTIAILSIVSILGVGWSNSLAYLNIIKAGELSRTMSITAPELMQNFRGQLAIACGADLPITRSLSLVLMILVSLAVLALWIRSHKDLLKGDKTLFDLCASVTVLAMLIASPHTHVQDYLVAVLPCTWLWPLVGGLTRGLILLYPVLTWVFFLGLPLFMALHIEPFFAWAIIMIVICLTKIRNYRGKDV